MTHASGYEVPANKQTNLKKIEFEDNEVFFLYKKKLRINLSYSLCNLVIVSFGRCVDG